jgi:hypothetical protein
MLRLTIAAAFMAGACGLLLAHAQTSVMQGTNARTPASPTSLEPDDPFALPRTPDGRPDFQGIVWDANFFAYLQGGAGNAPITLPEAQARPAFERAIAPLLASPLLALDPEAEDLIRGVNGFPLVRGERRTRMLVIPANGRVPFTDAARVELATAMPQPKLDNPEERDLMERCITPVGGFPPTAALSPAPNTRQFIQTPDHVVVHSEYFDQARIVPFATSFAPGVAASPHGQSFAWWDGDTLVIETTGMPPVQRRRGPIPALIVNSDATVIERYTRVSLDELLYQFTIEDPKVYAAPWLAEFSFYSAPFRMYPSECHEGNHSLPNILRGQRMEDERPGK